MRHILSLLAVLLLASSVLLTASCGFEDNNIEAGGTGDTTSMWFETVDGGEYRSLVDGHDHSRVSFPDAPGRVSHIPSKGKLELILEYRFDGPVVIHLDIESGDENHQQLRLEKYAWEDEYMISDPELLTISTDFSMPLKRCRLRVFAGSPPD